ncbi:hypothetical protein [Rugamonas sp.]|uniref:M61 family metallopeptidase n=1 Tax=Rugamonas sp. TaxID=1926287 RepID=UPI0025D196A3|nr:hypothetical protein [Rugamonas sp.]
MRPFIGLAALSLAAMVQALPANAAAPAEYALTVKPLLGADGKVGALDVREALQPAALPRDGLPLRLRAALSTFGVKAIAARVERLEVSDAAGAVAMLASDDAPSGRPDGAYRHWQAARQVSGPVLIRYRIATQAVDEQGGPPFGMKAAGGGVAGSGRGFLVLPENAASTSTLMRWDLSDLAAGSVGVITAGEGETVVAGPPQEMLELWMLAGPAAPYRSVRSPSFNAYVLGQPPFDAAAMLDWANRSYAYLAESLQYLGAPPYRLFMRTLDGPSFATGTARHDGGGSLITLGERYSKNQDLDYLHTVIFHEMTHQWVGQFDSAAPWFSEGLTTYLSAVLPCRAGIEEPAYCAASINSSTHTYYESDGRNWPLSRISASGSENVRRAPYGRGMLYFAMLDAQVRDKSQGARGLEALLLPLFQARQKGLQLNDAAWESMLARELGAQAVAEFRASVVEGDVTLIPPSDAFGPCLARYRAHWLAEGSAKPVDGYEWRPVACQR